MDKELFAALEYWDAIKRKERRGTTEMAWLRLRKALTDKLCEIDNEMYAIMPLGEEGEIEIPDFEINQDPPIYY